MLLYALEAIVSRLPFRVAQAVGAVLGLLVHALIPIRRSEVRRALARRLGAGRPQARLIARAMYRHLGISALEFLWMTRRAPDTLSSLVRVEGWEHFERARELGRGVVIATGHVGNWDLLACTQAARGVPLHVVTRRLKARGLDRYWMDRRSRAGVVLHDASQSMMALLGALRRGEVVGMVIDQRADDGVALPFLGAPALTSLGAATLAVRTGAMLLPVFMTRDPDGLHRMRIGVPIKSRPDLSAREAIVELTLCCNRALERVVREKPEQWLWLHRRWKVPAETGRRRKPHRVALAGRSRYTES